MKYGITDSESHSGTKATIFGYNENNQGGFSHEELKDYVYWFTKFGSFEKEVGITKHKDVVIWLRGFGWKEVEAEPRAREKKSVHE